MHKFLASILLTVSTSLSLGLQASLFDQDAPLKVEIQADFLLLETERKKENKYPGVLTIDQHQLPIELTVRGKNRLRRDTCRFSPLKVDFKKSPARKQTVFHKEGDLKLVVLCKKNSSYYDYLRTEYLAYKMLNALTPLSYRVRWVDVTYKTADKTLKERPAFFVEHKKRVAKRNGKGLDQPAKLPRYSNLDPHQTALLEQFQYFVGNTDYSLMRSPDPGECCHNAKLLSGENHYAPIIYDFDASGLVNTSYSAPPPQFKISTVLTRLFRGHCQEQTALQGAREQILGAKEEILAMVTSDPELSRSGIRRALRYTKASFAHFEKDKTWTKNIVNACREI
ncbi:hypothetical protein N8993_13380 [Pseudomonadales bacterium]|nr:hypothetical protein [Pseudomonadales bacterium]